MAHEHNAPKDARFLSNADGVLRGLREDWEGGCNQERGEEHIGELREIGDNFFVTVPQS
jgi:hypothetical protein